MVGRWGDGRRKYTAGLEMVIDGLLTAGLTLADTTVESMLKLELLFRTMVEMSRYGPTAQIPAMASRRISQFIPRQRGRCEGC